ncbi:MAG TPA: hypothetical protein VMZ26_12765 [Pyrinomonadaceae bacterium]|nr:hypothetical protein [Pyrinomonadaceae bacterium]
MSPILRSIAFLLILATFAAAQTDAEKKAAAEKENLKKEAVVFLRETLSDVNGMRSLENRISFASELAGLMWFHDEREARSMYAALIGDFRDLLMRYDAQMNALGVTPEDAEGRTGRMIFLVEPDDKSRVLRRFATAMGVRQAMAMSIAEHDAELAFGFYNDSLSAISNPEFRKHAENRDSYFESQLLVRIAESNPGKASQYASKSLAKGFAHHHLDLLKKIYEKDPDKGVEFGSAILSKLKDGKAETSADLYLISALLGYGGEILELSRKPKAKRPIYTAGELREIAEIMAQKILDLKDNELSSALSYTDTIEKYAPGRAAQIRTRVKRGMRNSNFNGSANSMYTATNESYGNATISSNSNSNAAGYQQQVREREEREKAEQKLIEDVQSLTTKQLPKEEREKIVTQARKIIMQTPGRDKKIMSLGMLAAQVAKMGDKELASEIMRDAERLVNPAPKNYQDFMLTWILASGYANADPDKAFPILEETIGRANDTLAAFIKVGEFIDVAEEMIQDGEVQVGAFGGQMVRGLTGELGMADATIQILAKADFVKTKNLTNRFDRAEIRVLAKMMVLRAVLNPKDPTKPDVMMDGEPTSEPMDN